MCIFERKSINASTYNRELSIMWCFVQQSGDGGDRAVVVAKVVMFHNPNPKIKRCCILQAFALLITSCLCDEMVRAPRLVEHDHLSVHSKTKAYTSYHWDPNVNHHMMTCNDVQLRYLGNRGCTGPAAKLSPDLLGRKRPPSSSDLGVAASLLDCHECLGCLSSAADLKFRTALLN